MAKKNKRIQNRTERVKPLLTRRVKQDSTIENRPLTKRFLKVTAIKSLSKNNRSREIQKIKQQSVRPMLSKLSPHPCQAKKNRVRHEYFSMIKSGKGGSNRKLNHSNRFTIRC